jgi:hypothetical protein
MAIGAEIPFGWSVRSRRAIDDRFITADLTTRDALSTFRRHKNLEVFVESTNRSYYIDNDTTNSDWMEVLKSIDVLTEDSAITNDDFLVWFDESEKSHKKVKRLNFKVLLGQLDQGGATTGQVIAWNGAVYAPTTVSGSKWGGGATSADTIFRSSSVVIGQGSDSISSSSVALRVVGKQATGTMFELFTSTYANIIIAAHDIVNIVPNLLCNNTITATNAVFVRDPNTNTVVFLRASGATGYGNMGLSGESYGGGNGVFYLKNATTIPSSNPSDGGILYTDGGALKYRGSSGTVTTIANA